MATRFQVWLRSLPDDIARAAEAQGRPLRIVLPAEPPEHSRRLLETLGVEWEVERVTVTGAAEVGRSYDCQQPGCMNSARSRVGRYSYCEEHQQSRAASRAAEGPRPAPTPLAPLPSGASLEEKVKRLQKLGRDADKARAVAKRKAQAALQAQAAAEEIARQFRALGREMFGEETAR